MAISANYYVDLDSGNDTNPGTSTGSPFKTIQKAADTATAAQVVAVKTGTETLTVPIDFDTANGSGGDTIQFVGVNSSWDEDDSMVTVDANSTAAYCINRTVSYIYFRNFWFKNATTDNIENGNYFYFFNCRFSGSSGGGAEGARDMYVNCTFDNNAGTAVHINTSGAVDRCFMINGNRGFEGNAPPPITNSIIHNMSNIGIIPATLANQISGNIIDGCGTGINCSGPTTISNNRITNCTTKGINLTALTFMSNNFFHGNTSDYGTLGNIAYLQKYNRESNTSDGYTDRSNDDFTLSAGGEGVGVAVKVGELAETSTFYITQGVPPEYASAGGLQYHPGMSGGMRG